MTRDTLYAAIAPKKPIALAPLRDTFLQHKTAGARYLDDAEALSAYRAFFFPQTFAKVASVLGELPEVRPKVVVDLGAAMAPAAFAAWYHARPERLIAVDFSAQALNDAKAIARTVGAPLETIHHDLKAGWPKAAPERCDLVLACNALSELPTLDAQETLIVDILARTKMLIIIEPADRIHARNLQTLRDRLLARGHTPRMPCPHDQGCPALVRERDFCHEARALDMPGYWPALAAGAGLTDTRMRFSYLVFGGDPPTHPDGVMRIISHPVSDKGRLRYFACSSQGLVELLRQDKNKRPHNTVFDALDRGTLLTVPGVTPTGHAPSHLKLGPDDEIRLI